ncbi:MAG: hypothetical protein K6E56_02060 [Lachnospiraceae bacterium]|nr:hypothetical protein [Lachnospiraceae bacterium]
MSIDSLYDFIYEKASEHDFKQTLAALPFARKSHEGQFRDGDEGIPYFLHPLAMARHAYALGIRDDDVLATLLLHDVVEDCDVSVDALPASDRVKKAVSLVTFNINPGETKPDAKARYFKDIETDPLASLCKIIDRCNNISSMAKTFSVPRMQRYLTETETYILPLIASLEHLEPSYSEYCFLLAYQIKSVLRSIKRFI